MYAQVEKANENTTSANWRKSRAFANSFAQKKTSSKHVLGFVDNRTESYNHRAIQLAIKNSIEKNQNHHKQCNCSKCSSSLQQIPTESNLGIGFPVNLSNSSKIVQRQCDNCNNIFCHNGSICGSKKRKYKPGKHGFKKIEQKQLTNEFGMKVTGSNFESEHSVGFEPINQTSVLKRGSKGRAYELEFSAPAYQEYKPFHRKHIGTGSSLNVDESGFNSQTYREYQRNLIESKDISSSVQINQLGYAFNPQFQNKQGSKEMDISNDSFNIMVGGMNEFKYASGNKNKVVKVDKRQQAEMFLSREISSTGKWPTKKRIKEVKNLFGLV